MTTYNDQLAAQANIVTERIAEKAPGYNDWPDFPVLKIMELNVFGNASDALEHGEARGGLSTMRQVQVKQLPREIRALLPPYDDNGYVNVFFTLAPSAGQEDPATTRNLRAIFDHRRVYGALRKHPLLGDYPALHVTIGCAHDYDRAGSNPRRGYNIGRCRKCGHRFVCDSGD